MVNFLTYFFSLKYDLSFFNRQFRRILFQPHVNILDGHYKMMNSSISRSKSQVRLGTASRSNHCRRQVLVRRNIGGRVFLEEVDRTDRDLICVNGPDDDCG